MLKRGESVLMKLEKSIKHLATQLYTSKHQEPFTSSNWKIMLAQIDRQIENNKMINIREKKKNFVKRKHSYHKTVN